MILSYRGADALAVEARRPSLPLCAACVLIAMLLFAVAAFGVGCVAPSGWDCRTGAWW